ncbi:DUF4349 domain-containing protein, partial [Bacillus tequilensis]|nr:DUF4349 domain-containing protein [Bacillus tequilensis]
MSSEGSSAGDSLGEAASDAAVDSAGGDSGGGATDGPTGAEGDGKAEGGVVAPRDEPGSKGADEPIASVDDTREIVVTAEMALRVRDADEAADRIASLAVERGGFVESASLGLAPDAGDVAPEEPREPGTGRISIRGPAADLEEVMDAIGDDAEVLSSSISRDDVTATAVDLRARIASARTSVERLTDLMGKSGSVSDLIAAESALSERQAQLESYEQQLKHLDEQVALSTISITLTEEA